MSLVHSIVRRGADAAISSVTFNNGNESQQVEISPFLGSLIVLTVVTYLFSAAAINYTYGQLIAVLAMIETPTATAIVHTVSADSQDPDAPLLSNKEKEDRSAVQQEILLVKQKPITANLSTTVKHLQSRTGSKLARFRGVQIALIYELLHSFISGGGHHHGLRIIRLVTPIVATGALSLLDVVYVHHIISEPGKAWYKRFDYRLWKKVVIPSIAVTAVTVTACSLPVIALMGLSELARQIQDQADLVTALRENQTRIIMQLAAALILAVGGFVFVVIPAHIALVRVQASLLPVEDESIVPFDRTFGGRVMPAVVGGSGMISLRDAWTTFDWSARVRLTKVWVKTAALQVALFAMFITALGLEFSTAIDIKDGMTMLRRAL